MKLGLVCLLVLLVVLAAFLRPKRKELRGRVLLTQRQAQRREAQSTLPDAADDVTWGGLRLPADAETSHFLAVGTTGSGKSLTIQGLMREAFQSFGSGRDKRALVYDSKLDLFPFLEELRLSVPVHTLHAFDERGVSWNMAEDITDLSAALQVAATLVPVEEGSANRYFSDTARDLLCGVMLNLAESGEPWGLRDLVLTMRNRGRLEEVLSCTERGEELLELHGGSAEAFRSVLSTARSRLAPFEPVADAWAERRESVSLKHWVRGDSVLLLGCDESAREAVDTVNRLLFVRAAELTLQRPNSQSRRSWFVLDEVREAGKLDALRRLLNKGRSKGACVVLGFQDIHGLKALYGEHEALEMVGQCSSKALLRLESPETAKWAASAVGQYESIQVLRGRSRETSLVGRGQRTENEQRVTRDAVLPSEFFSLPWASPEEGVPGYFIAPRLGAFRWI